MVCQERLMLCTLRVYTLVERDTFSQRLKTEVSMPERYVSSSSRLCCLSGLDTGGMSCLYFSQGREGVVIVKTKQAILIAHYGETMIAGNSATTVEQLADYLIKSGY